MKLPKKKKDKTAERGKRKLPPRPGGGAAGRAYQFELEHGLDKAGTDDESDNDSSAEQMNKKIGRSE